MNITQWENWIIFFVELKKSTSCNQPLQESEFGFLLDYFPKKSAPNAKPSKRAAIIIIAVWILPVASG